MSTQQTNIVLSDLQGLYDLLNQHKFSLFPKEGNITLEMNDIEESEKSRWQEQLKQYYFACGCKEGSLTSLSFFFGYWIYIIFFVGIRSIMNWEVWVISVLFLFFGAIIGKAVGLIYSRYALTIAVRKLILMISKNT